MYRRREEEIEFGREGKKEKERERERERESEVDISEEDGKRERVGGREKEG